MAIHTSSRHLLDGLFAVFLGGLLISPVRGDVIFVADFNSGTIGEYTTAGAPINPALISGLNHPIGIAVSGSDLFVANESAGGPNDGVISKYTTAGVLVTPALISGIPQPLLRWRYRARICLS